MLKQLHVVMCYFARGTNIVAKGTAAYVLNAWNLPAVFLIARSREGRWVKLSQDIDKLARFHLSHVKGDHPLFGDIQQCAVDHDVALDMIRAYNRMLVSGFHQEAKQ